MPALPAFSSSSPPRRVSAEIDALWQLTEQLTQFTARPVAALGLVTRTAGELTNAEAAAVLLHPGEELVLASRWGALGMPLGYKSIDVRATLDAAWPKSATMPIRRGTHEIGCLWIGHPSREFSVDEQRILRTLAAVTSLSLASLLEVRKPEASTADATQAHATPLPDAAKPPPLDRGFMVPEAMRLSVVPPSLDRLLRAVDDGADLDRIAAIVRLDPVLAALVLRAGHSAAAGRARPAETLRDAIVFLGIRRVRTLALAKFTQGLVAGHGPLHAFLWEQAVGTATRTPRALRAVDGQADEDTATLAGLFQPIGAIALATAHPERYERTLRRSVADDCSIEVAERETFGIDGTTLTHQLLHAWHLAGPVASLRDRSGETTRAAVEWAAHVALATNPTWLGWVAESGAAVTWLPRRIAESAARLGLDETAAAIVARESAAAVDDTRALLAAS